MYDFEARFVKIERMMLANELRADEKMDTMELRVDEMMDAKMMNYLGIAIFIPTTLCACSFYVTELLRKDERERRLLFEAKAFAARKEDKDFMKQYCVESAFSVAIIAATAVIIVPILIEGRMWDAR